jgi:isocitrate lyase
LRPGACALANEFAFELRNGFEDVTEQHAVGGGRIDVLLHTLETNASCLKTIHPLD